MLEQQPVISVVYLKLFSKDNCDSKRLVCCSDQSLRRIYVPQGKLEPQGTGSCPSFKKNLSEYCGFQTKSRQFLKRG